MVVLTTNNLPGDASLHRIQGGTDLEFQVLTMSQGDYMTMSFGSIPNSIEFTTRSGIDDVSFALTNSPGNVYRTIQGGSTLGVDLAKAGPYYFAISSVLGTVIEGMALL